MADFSLYFQYNKKSQTKRRDFLYKNLINLTEGLGDVEWSPVINKKNTNQSLNKFYDILTE